MSHVIQKICIFISFYLYIYILKCQINHIILHVIFTELSKGIYLVAGDFQEENKQFS